MSRKESQKTEDRIQLISAVAHLMMVDPPPSKVDRIMRRKRGKSF